ncbi:enoyl-CoA hydratase/isomerase family protein [Bacteriovoracaceae bacterium]|nr:enoyl-CoA hydratase/isomerase family protein [Bacteriovoracaceae bacterium]
MLRIFNFNTLLTFLDQNTRSLHVQLKNGENNYITTEMILELENLLNWAHSHIEINSLYFSSKNEYFSHGIDPKVLESLDEKQLEGYTLQINKIIDSILNIPQTTIINIGKGCMNFASELALAFDLRISRSDASMQFEHSALGTIPTAGGINLLSTLIHPSFAKNVLLGTHSINYKELQSSHLVFKQYNSDKDRLKLQKELLLSLNKQSSVARIQTKLGINQTMVEQLEKNNEIQQSIFKAFMLTKDWKSKKEFTKPREVKKSVSKLRLIKSEDLQ